MVLAAMGLMEDEQKDYDMVLGKFDKYFKVRQNVILREHASTDAATSVVHSSRHLQIRRSSGRNGLQSTYHRHKRCHLVTAASARRGANTRESQNKDTTKGSSGRATEIVERTWRREQRGSRTPPVTAKINAHEQKTGS